MTISNGKIPRIGILITNLHEAYSKLLCYGVLDQAEESGAEVLVFRCEAINTPYDYSYQYNTLLELLPNRNLDCLILASGTLCNYISKEDFAQLIDRLKKTPLISISMEIPGIPSILIDNKFGITEAVEHLVKVHSRKKIAFIRGPETNPEAINRYEAFLQKMHDLGLKAEQNLIISGDFMEDSGIAAMRELLDLRKAQFDALIASNDVMAIGAMKELQKRNYKIPQDISVIGFDNVIGCEYAKPPLSSIRQPIYLQGRKALLAAIDIIQGREVKQTLYFPTSLIKRYSCGCLSHTYDTPVNYFLTSKERMTSAQSFNRGNFLQEIQSILNMADYTGPHRLMVEQILIEWIGFLENDSSDEIRIKEFLKKLSEMLTEQIRQGINIVFWKDIIDKLFHIPTGEKKAEEWYGITQKALLLIQDLYENYLVSEQVAVDKTELILHMFMQDLLPSRSLEEFSEKIAEVLPKLDINGIEIIVFNQIISHSRWEKMILPDTGNLVLSVDKEDGRCIFASEEMKMAPTDLIKKFPSSANTRKSHIIYPLFLQEEYYGFIRYEMNTRYTNVYEFLTRIISSAYRSVIILQELNREKSNLKRRNAEIENEIFMARRIQAQLIPKKSPWTNISYCYKQIEKVGGDFFDFIEFQGKNWLGIFLSDVSGHGIPAAFITSMIKSSINQMRPLQDNPYLLLLGLNEALANQTGDNFVTAFYGIYMPDTNEFIFANAGHPMPYVIKKSSVSLIEPSVRGMPLGLMNSTDFSGRNPDFANNRLKLESGTKLVLYTDGLIETTKKDAEELEFANNGLERLFLSLAKKPAAIFIAETYLQLVEFHGSDEFNDDICIICLDIR